ncbi:retinol dehydrogenase 12-like [Daphnia carinata]|uniref:retinol dehydrogenase 12-like n=1 Tax=Daphnia carinata TaxID=120202 RepID=UPI00257C37A4|nr:retinol dehydrogenase 12-like [Daphnia carinata]
MGILSTSLGIGATCGGLYALRRWRENQWESCKTNRRLDGQVAVITGATSGLGKVLAEDLVNRGAVVVLACRNTTAAKEVAAEIKQQCPGALLDVVELDLSSLESVRKCANILLERYTQINILVCNAGVSIPPKMGIKTVEGYEINFGVNHLGHFLLTNLLVDRLIASAPSRIVIVSSKLHEQGSMDWEGFEGTKEFEGGKRGPNAAYCSSKLANVYFGIKLAEKLENRGVNVYTVCPGWNYTKLFRYSSVPFYSWIAIIPIAFWFMKPARIGVQTLIHCAVSEDTENETGLFYRDCKVYQTQANLKPKAINELWELSCKLCKVEWY